MMLSTKGRYAIMAMLDLAIHGKGIPVNLAEISRRQEITISYLEQIFLKLRKSGLVISYKGPGGGYLLSAKPEEISLAQIINASEESIKITKCTGAREGCKNSGTKCLTHELWDDLGNHIEEFFQIRSLASLILQNERVLA